MAKPKRHQNHKPKGKPQKPSIKIPSSPSATSKNASAIQLDNSATPGDLHSDEPSPFETPPTSPPPVAAETLPMADAAPQPAESSPLGPESTESKQEYGTQDEVDNQEQIPLPDQNQHLEQGETQQASTGQEETQLLTENKEDATVASDDPKEPHPTAEKPEEEESSTKDAKNTQSFQEEDPSQSPGRGESNLPPVEDTGIPGGQALSDPDPERQGEKGLGSPGDGRAQLQALSQDTPDEPQPQTGAGPEGEEQTQMPVQTQQSPEDGQDESSSMPEGDGGKIEPSGQDQEQLVEEDPQSKTAENAQQSSELDHQQDQEPGPPSRLPDVDHNEKPLTPIDADDVTSKDILTIANALSTMKTTFISMANAFDRIGQQAETMVSISLDLQAKEQIRRVQSAVEQQIIRQKHEIEALRSALREKIKHAVEEKIRNQAMEVIRGSLKQEVEERVRIQLAIQIPENLKQQVISHKRQILEVRASLHNSEARRHNSLQTVPGPHARLRPLLRPLPTPEQSPVILISRSSSMEPSTFPTPATAFPQAPAPTPIKRVSSNSLRSTLMSEAIPPTPSRLFPRDLTALFALSQEEARTLLREYGLDSAISSPTKESARPRGLSIVNEENLDMVHDEDPDAHARDLNKFMAHIGVPFLMIPAPKEKIDLSAPLSSRSRRKLLTPLIIK